MPKPIPRARTKPTAPAPKKPVGGEETLADFSRRIATAKDTGQTVTMIDFTFRGKSDTHFLKGVPRKVTEIREVGFVLTDTESKNPWPINNTWPKAGMVTETAPDTFRVDTGISSLVYRFDPITE